MHSCNRSLATRTSKLPRSISKISNTARPYSSTVTITPSRRMASFFRPHSHYYNAEPNFQGLFRLIDDFDRYSSQNGSSGRGAVPTFTPKFDMKETETGFELHGELPGVSKEDVHLEFTDPQTLQVRGKVERTHTEGEPPAGLLEGSDSANKTITEGGEKPASHKVTVEDDPEESKTAEAQPTESAQAEQQPAEQQQQQQQAVEKASNSSNAQKPQSRYYLVERSVGTFARSFHFPTRVDTDSVEASLRDGILTVTVQKARKHEGRRITVN